METQMFTSFIQERDLRRQGLRGTEVGLVIAVLLAVVDMKRAEESVCTFRSV